MGESLLERETVDGGGGPHALLSRAFAWGSGEDGQLGVGNLEDEHIPIIVPTLSGSQVHKVIAGSRFSLAITKQGELYTWGWNQRGTLGFAPQQKAELSPRLVEGLTGKHIVQAACGGWHCLALDREGNTYAWGGHEYGQCGVPVERNLQGKVMNRDISSPVNAVPQLRAVQIGAGGMHSLVLTDRGEVWTWGQPLIASGNFDLWRPAKVPMPCKAVKVAAGAFHNLALLENGQVVSWGNGSYGQLGHGDNHNKALPTPIADLDSSIPIIGIYAGGWHSAAITAEGEVWVWGRGEHGRLGLGLKCGDQLRPVKLAELAGKRIVHLSLGGSHSAALADDGSLFAFGRGEFGRLGRAVTTTSYGPVQVDVAPVSTSPEPLRWRVTDISCGGRHTLAIAEPMPTVRDTEMPESSIAVSTVEDPEIEALGEKEREGRPKGSEDEGVAECTQTSPVAVLDADLDQEKTDWGLKEEKLGNLVGFQQPMTA